MEKKCLYHWKEVPICVCLDVCTGKLNCTWADADLNCHNMGYCKHKDYGISKVWYGNSRKLSEVVNMSQNTENTTQSIDNSKMYCGYDELYKGNYDCPYVDVNHVCTSKECCYRETARKHLKNHLDSLYGNTVKEIIAEETNVKDLKLGVSEGTITEGYVNDVADEVADNFEEYIDEAEKKWLEEDEKFLYEAYLNDLRAYGAKRFGGKW